MIKWSSSRDHLLCFLAGDSDVWGGMLRFPDTSTVAARTVCPGCAAAAYNGGTEIGPVVMDAAAVDGGTDADRVCRGEDVEDSFESGALRSEAISTVTVKGLESLE